MYVNAPFLGNEIRHIDLVRVVLDLRFLSHEGADSADVVQNLRSL